MEQGLSNRGAQLSPGAGADLEMGWLASGQALESIGYILAKPS